MKKRILVFPCGSEIGLEIYRSVRYSTYFELIGGSSIKDHGNFVYEKIIENIPFYDDPRFERVMLKIVDKYKIDAIYPTMDSVAEKLASMASFLSCKVITSSVETTAICLSKSKTYELLEKVVSVPKWALSIDEINFPAFVKPDIGYGSREVTIVENYAQAKEHKLRNKKKKFVYCEFLPGEEYTIDCFTNRHGQLLFAKARLRNRILNGISVNAAFADDATQEVIKDYANRLNKNLSFSGAWFFQLKRAKSSELKLLEVAARFGGSSSICRGLGVNFSLLSLFDAFGYDVSIDENNYNIELDRALNNRFRLDINYDVVYVDLDDCIIIDNKININLIGFLHQAINNGKEIVLITRHNGDLNKTLKKYRIKYIFDKIYHIKNRGDVKKFEYINNKSAIFIDDSYEERISVKEEIGIPTFSPDMVECLLNN